MTNPRQDLALENLRNAIKAAGGSVHVASLADVPQTYLSTISHGSRQMGREVAAKLRPHLELSADDWVELLLPVAPDVEAQA